MALTGSSFPHQQVNMPALDLRRYLSVLVQTEGVGSANDLQVQQRAAGANMSVDIASGEAYVQGDSVANQGMYWAYNDATFNLTGFTAAHATLPRIDRVALRVRDAFHGDAANDMAFVILTGTATSGATLANLNGAASVGNGHLLLANVLIPATATTITTANIDTTGASNNTIPVRAELLSAGARPPVIYNAYTGAGISVTSGWIETQRVTVPKAGNYLATASVYSTFGTAGQLYMGLGVNSATTPTIQVDSTSFDSTMAITNYPVTLNANEFVTILSQQGGSGATGGVHSLRSLALIPYRTS